MSKANEILNASPIVAADAITQFNGALTPEHAAICNALRKEIDAALPDSTCRIWYANPVWFIGEDPIVGYNITARQTVNLLFWSGQLFEEPTLKSSGKFKAAQVQFKDVSEIDIQSLHNWLKQSSHHIFDYKAMRRSNLAC
jgi:hypothetical protein